MTEQGYSFNSNFSFNLGMNPFMPALPWYNSVGLQAFFLNFKVPDFRFCFPFLNTGPLVGIGLPFNFGMQSVPSVHAKGMSVGNDNSVFAASKKEEDESSMDSFKRTSGDNIIPEGYNSEAGEKLAKIAWKNRVGWRKKCAAFVKNAIQEAGMGAYEKGHAWQVADILRKNKNFREISPAGIDASKLPAGCVLVFGRENKNYSKRYGHVEITCGDGTAVSDGVTRNIKKPTAIFIPV